jgi:hypothetical protein
VHLAGAAVKAKGQAFIAIDQGHGVGPDLALDPDHALGLFGAEAEGVAQAMLGDHQRDLAGLLGGLVGGIDQGDPRLRGHALNTTLLHLKNFKYLIYIVIMKISH